MYINNYTSQLKMSINQINQATRNVSHSQARLSSGDSFAGKNENPVSFSQASRAEALMRGSSAATRNIQDANAFLESKESGLSKMESIGQRLRDLAVEYENDLLNEKDKSLIQKESAYLLKELEHTQKNTTYNGKNVFEQKDLKFQTGSNAGDTFTIQSNALFSFSFDAKEEKPVPPIENPTPVEPVEPVKPDKGSNVERTYEVSIKSGPYSDSNAKMTIQNTKDPNVSTFTLKSNNLTFSGKITFSEDGKERFELENTTPYGKLAGEVKLDKKSSKDDLEGQHHFILDRQFGGVDVTVKMKETSEKEVDKRSVSTDSLSFKARTSSDNSEVKTETEQKGIEEKSDGDNSNKLEFELTTDFIDKHILNPITENLNQVGVERNVLEYRLESADNTAALATKDLSRIRDTDTAKEMMKMTKQQMLIDINANLFSKSLDQYRNHILSLLS